MPELLECKAYKMNANYVFLILMFCLYLLGYACSKNYINKHNMENIEFLRIICYITVKTKIFSQIGP